MKKVLVVILVATLVNFANAALVLSASGPGVTHTGGSNYQIEEGTIAAVSVFSDIGIGESGILTLTNCPAVASFVNLPPGVSNGASIGSSSACDINFMNMGGGSGLQVSADVRANGTSGQNFKVELYDGGFFLIAQLNFTIVPVPETVTLLSPNGGESLTAGTVHSVTWSSTGSITNVKLEYSDDDGAGWIVIEASTANDGQYDWTVPEVDSDQCLVRVSDASDAGVEDESDAVFSIEIPCFPVCHPDFDEWVSVGMPESWCNPRQCKGDADGCIGGGMFGYWAVMGEDLNVLFAAWKVKEPPFGPGIDTVSYYMQFGCAATETIPGIAADLDHRVAGSPYTGHYRVGVTDFCIMNKYWMIAEPDAPDGGTAFFPGPGISADCLECDGCQGCMEGPVLSLQIDTGGGFYDPGDSVELSLDQIVTIGIENSTSDQHEVELYPIEFYDAYVEMAGDLTSGHWTGTTWYDPLASDSAWTYFGTSVLADKDAWEIELIDPYFFGDPNPVLAPVSSSVEYQKVGPGETTIILYNEFYEVVDTLTITGLPAVTVVTPNGGEDLIAGDTYPITWHGTPGDVKIEYSSNSGTDWTVIDANTPSDGEYEWTAPSIDSDECLVRITDASDPGVSDVSDGVFTIYQCQLDSPANFDSDCQVGVADLGVMMLNWLGGDSIADIAPPPDGDLEVDLKDFALFSAEWLRNGNPFDPGFTEAP